MEYLSFWAEVEIADQAHYKVLKDRLNSYNPEATSKETLESTADALKAFKEEDGVISQRKSGRECITWLNAQARNLSSHVLQETSEHSTPDQQARAKDRRLKIREQIKSAMVDQFFERDMYFYTVNAMEGRIGEDSPQKYFSPEQAQHASSL